MVADALGLYPLWAEKFLPRDEDNLSALSHFLQSDAGASLRLEGLSWVSQAPPCRGNSRGHPAPAQGGPMPIDYDPSHAALYTPEKHETLFQEGATCSPVQLAIESSRLAYY